jgi:copper chaperone NosL
MAISQIQFAAEIIDRDENVYKFDDIGCMRDFIRHGQLKAPAAEEYVRDYSTKEWLTAKAAHFVRAAAFSTPMGSGIVAFRERAGAEEFAHAHGSQVTGYDGLP